MFVHVLKKIIKNDFVRLIIFTFILFNPIIYCTELLRVYRDNFYSSLLLILVCCAFGIFFNYKEKVRKIVPYMVGLGIIGTWMAITREETIWVSPFIIGSAFITSLFIIFDKKCQNKLKKILLYLIPIIIYLITIFIVCLFNKIAYGEFIRTEQSSKAYKNFIKAASSVDSKNTNIKISITKEARQKISEVSPSFKKLDKHFEIWEKNGIVEGELEDGWLMWAILYSMDMNGLTTNVKTMNDYFRKMTDEINQAFKDGRLKKEDNPESIFDKDNFNELINSFKDTFEYQLNLEKVMLRATPDEYYNGHLDDEGMIKQNYEYSEITGNISNNPLTYNYKADKIKIKTLELILKIYEHLSKPLFIIGILIYIIIILKFFIIKPRFENYKELIVLTSFLLLFFLRILVIAYTNATKFPATSVMYLSSTYSMMFGFEILSLIFGINGVIKLIKEGTYARKTKKV